MALRVSLLDGPGIVNDRDQPVPVPPDIEDNVTIDVIGILKNLPYFSEIVPSSRLDDACPGSHLTRCVWVLLHGFAQMPACDEMHLLSVLHNL